MPPENAFAPLPIKRRGTLEILDTALKLYRRYFGVLISWSALSAAVWILLFFVQFAYILTYPLIFGSVACCVAAAVRGQKVTFGQAWNFTKPRYGSVVGLAVLSLLMMLGVFIVFTIAGVILFIAGAYLTNYLPTAFGVVGAILGYILLLVVYSILSMVLFVWQSIVLFVVCLEDDKRGTMALGRAWALLQGHWKSVFGLSSLLAIAFVAMFGIIGGFLAFFGQVTNIFSSNPSVTAIYAAIAGWSVVLGLFSVLWVPAQTMISAVLYLDLRVRKEALDLEWAAYATRPPVAQQTGGAVENAPQSPASGAFSAPEFPAMDAMSPSAFGANPTGANPTATPPITATGFTTPPTHHPNPSPAPPATDVTSSYPTVPPVVPPPTTSAPPPVDFTAPTVSPSMTPSVGQTPVPPQAPPGQTTEPAPTPTPTPFSTHTEAASSFAPSSSPASEPSPTSFAGPSFTSPSSDASSPDTTSFGSSSFGGPAFGTSSFGASIPENSSSWDTASSFGDTASDVSSGSDSSGSDSSSSSSDSSSSGD